MAVGWRPLPSPQQAKEGRRVRAGALGAIRLCIAIQTLNSWPATDRGEVGGQMGMEEWVEGCAAEVTHAIIP